MILRRSLLLALLATAPVAAQDAATPPAANPEDVASIDAILASLYDVISGPAGEKRDWDRMRSLFGPDGRLIPTGRNQAGQPVRLTWDVDTYIQRAGAQLEQGGFFETEIHREVHQYGRIAQVFSSYESRRTLEDAEPFARGINSIQLWNDGTRWWVLSVFWQGESPDTPIPAEYLPPAS